jgi:hypothetical protein
LPKRAQADSARSCSFCHKHQDVVGKLISSPSDYPRAYICDECVAVCNSIMEDEIDRPPEIDRTPEIQHLREKLRLLLNDVPDSDLETVAKILRALV